MRRIRGEFSEAIGEIKSLLADLDRELGRMPAFKVNVAKWAASAWDDINGEPDREVNPVSLVAKLLTITAAASAAIILVIDLGLLVTSPWR
jgi:hypothetical protein